MIRLVVSSVTMNKCDLVFRPSGTNAIARSQMNKADFVGFQSNENGSEMPRINIVQLIEIQMNNSEFVGRPSNELMKP